MLSEPTCLPRDRFTCFTRRLLLAQHWDHVHEKSEDLDEVFLDEELDAEVPDTSEQTEQRILL